MTFKSYCA